MKRRHSRSRSVKDERSRGVAMITLRHRKKNADDRGPDLVHQDHPKKANHQTMKQERSLLAPIHSDFVVRWQEVLKLGLPDDTKAELLKKYPPPENCIFLDPPKINKEIDLSLKNEVIKNRDAKIIDKQ
ncbi:hypothetical protein TKK_0017337 [Trichogramma kaykai]